MQENEFNIYISISCLSDMGLELLVTEDVPGFYPHKTTELMHYYSMLFQMDLEYETLFGPMPILDHFEYLAYIFPFKITNPDVKDSRFVAADFIVPAFVLLICPIELTSLIGNNQSKIVYELNYSLSKEIQTVDGFKQLDLSSLKENLIHHLRVEQVSNLFKTDFSEVANIRSRLDEISNIFVKLNLKPEILVLDEDPKTIELFKEIIMLRGFLNLKDCELREDYLSADIGNCKLTIIRASDVNDKLLAPFITNNLLATCLIVNYSSSSSIKYNTLVKKLVKNTPSDSFLGLFLSEKSTVMSFDQTEIPLLIDDSRSDKIMFYELTSLNYTICSTLTNLFEQIIRKLKI